MASSTLVSSSTNLTREGSTISPNRIVLQSRPWNLGSPALVGGLLIRSWKACCEREGCREARGEPGPPRICSAKLPRWPCGDGLPIARPGGGERPSEAVELLRDCSGEGTWPSLFLLGVSKDSAIVEEGAILSAGCDGLECALLVTCGARSRLPDERKVRIRVSSQARSIHQNKMPPCAIVKYIALWCGEALLMRLPRGTSTLGASYSLAAI